MAVQVFILDQIFLFGFISPMIYVLFILLLPIRINLPLYLITAFGYGLILDYFQDTGGAHAAACLTLAFSRDFLLKIVYGESYKLKNLKIVNSEFNRLILFLVLAIFLHHLIFYLLVIFNITQILEITKMALLVGIASFVVSFLTVLLIKPKRS